MRQKRNLNKNETQGESKLFMFFVFIFASALEVVSLVGIRRFSSIYTVDFTVALFLYIFKTFFTVYNF